jgi:hypothetical protein
MQIKTVGQLKTDIYRTISPAKPSDSKDENGAIVQATENMLGTIKPKELSRRVVIENALYDQVNQYTCPDDLDTNKIMQWYRLRNYSQIGSFYNPMKQVSNIQFDQSSMNCDAQNVFAIEYQSSKKFLKVSDFTTGGGWGNNATNAGGDNRNNTGLTIHEMNDLTSNGTWNVGGNLVNLVTDNLSYVTGRGSIRFDLNTSSNTGTMTSVGMTAVDLSEYLNVGKIFTWLYVPNLNQIVTITLNMYSSPTDYYSITVNSPHDTDTFQVELNLLGFEMDQSTMNTVGTPNPANINQIEFVFVVNNTLLMDSMRLDNIVARKGHVYGLQYISNQIFKDAVSGQMKWRPTADTDIIITEYDTYQVLLACCTMVFAMELLNGAGIAVIRNKIINPYLNMQNAAIMEYKKRHKEEYTEQTQNLRNFGCPWGWYGMDSGWGHRGHSPNDLLP